ncbi:MAG: sulfur carrier protein ThiS [Oscillospiraceae bacterium]
MKINGELINLKNNITITDLLLEKGYNQKRVAIELNGTIIKKSEFDTTTLSDKDTLEIVNFVGGG